MRLVDTVAILAQGTTSGQCVSQGLFVFSLRSDPRSAKVPKLFLMGLHIPTSQTNFRDLREEGEELEFEFEFQFQSWFTIYRRHLVFSWVPVVFMMAGPAKAMSKASIKLKQQFEAVLRFRGLFGSLYWYAWRRSVSNLRHCGETHGAE